MSVVSEGISYSTGTDEIEELENCGTLGKSKFVCTYAILLSRSED